MNCADHPGRAVARGLWAAFFLLVFLAPKVSLAQQTRIPVEVVHTGDDQVGSGIVFQLKENIRASQSMRLVTDTSVARIRVAIVSIDDDRKNPGIRSALSLTFVYDSLDIPLLGLHLSSSVQSCGRDRIASCAQDNLVSIDKAIEDLRKYGSSYWRALQGR